MCFHLDSLEPRQFLSAPYQIQDLGSLGGDTVIAKDINERGQIVGEATGPDGESRAFLWSSCDGIRDLAIPSFHGADAAAINDRGQIIGTATYDASLVGQQAFLISDGKLQFLPRPRDPDNNIAVDINDRGQILTFEFHITGNELGSTILYDPSLKSSAVVAIDQSYAINNSGIIAGIQPPPPYSRISPAFSSSYVNGYAINDKGIRVSLNYLSEGGNIITIGDGQTTTILQKQEDSPHINISKINNSNVFVGSAWSDTPITPLFGWIRDGNLLRDLNSLIPKKSGWQILHATAINDKGQIVGDGLHNGQKRAFLLNPTKAAFPKNAGPTDIPLEPLSTTAPPPIAKSKLKPHHKPHHRHPARRAQENGEAEKRLSATSPRSSDRRSFGRNLPAKA